MNGKVTATFDPLGKLVSLVYPDGSELFGEDLDEYDEFMTDKFGPEWEENRSSIRLCQFDTANRPPERNVHKEGEPRLDPKEHIRVWVFDADGTQVGICYPDGTEIYGEAIAERNAMLQEKFGHQWKANKGKLTARRIETFE